MPYRTSLLIFLLLTLAGQSMLSQSTSHGREPSTGPLIKDFGKVYEVPEPGLRMPAEQQYRVLFDVSSSPEDKRQVNASIETLARFLNMHTRAGVSAENMRLVMVLHGGAAKDALNNDAYQERFGVDNPNLELLGQLAATGLEAYLCGQTASHHGIESKDLTPPVKMALSAMTALVLFQEKGYQLIPW